MSQTWWDAPPSDLRSIWWGQSTQPCFSSLLIFHGAPNGKNRFWPEAVTENGMGTSPLPPPDEIFVISYIPAYVSLGFSFIRDSTLEMFCGVVVASIQPQRSLCSNGVWPDLRRFPCKMQQTLSCKWTFMSICICITRLSPCGEIRVLPPREARRHGAAPPIFYFLFPACVYSCFQTTDHFGLLFFELWILDLYRAHLMVCECVCTRAAAGTESESAHDFDSI